MTRDRSDPANLTVAFLIGLASVAFAGGMVAGACTLALILGPA